MPSESAASDERGDVVLLIGAVAGAGSLVGWSVWTNREHLVGPS